MQVKSLVRSLSLKLSRENLAIREKDDVGTPPAVEEEQGETDDAAPECDPQETRVHAGGDLTDVTEEPPDDREEEFEEAETVQSPADSGTDNTPRVEESEEHSVKEPSDEESRENFVTAKDEPLEEEEEEEDDTQREEDNEGAAAAAAAPSASHSERSLTLPRSRSDADYEGHSSQSQQAEGRPTLQGCF